MDRLLGEIVEFLEARGYWSETVLILASDHGYHLGCTVAYESGARCVNWCVDHPVPHDCRIYDFEAGKPTDKWSNCTRRAAFIVSGGGLPSRFRGGVVERAEIVDVMPIIADLLGVEGYPFEGEKRSRNGLTPPGLSSVSPLGLETHLAPLPLSLPPISSLIPF